MPFVYKFKIRVNIQDTKVLTGFQSGFHPKTASKHLPGSAKKYSSYCFSSPFFSMPWMHWDQVLISGLGLWWPLKCPHLSCLQLSYDWFWKLVLFQCFSFNFFAVSRELTVCWMITKSVATIAKMLKNLQNRILLKCLSDTRVHMSNFNKAFL